MKNPLKFIQDVKQEAFKVTWPTAKETVQGPLMVYAMAVVASLLFLLLTRAPPLNPEPTLLLYNPCNSSIRYY